VRAAAFLRRELWLAVAATAAVGLLWAIGWLPLLERPVGDLMLRIPRPTGQPLSPFAAVLIDDDAVAAHGALPWPRSRLGYLVEEVNRLGAAGVVIDIVLSEPAEEAGDLALERALSGRPTVLAAVLRPGGGWLMPLERFGGSAVAAHAHAEVAVDGVVRRISSTKQATGIALPALAVAAARLAGWDGALTPGELLRPDFGQKPMGIPHWSAAEILDRKVPEDLLAGWVIFVGLSASGTGDRFVVPVGALRRPTPGVLVHAAAASAILRAGLIRVLPWWLSLFIALGLATVAQLLRTQRGRMPSSHLAALIVGVAAGGLLSLWIGLLQLPVVSLMVTVVLSAVGREVVESREAQNQTGEILRSLIEHEAGSANAPVPTGVGGRLQLVRSLQNQLVRDRDLRRTLLEGLNEGVVLWDADGTALLFNTAFDRLWGQSSSLRELSAATGRDAAAWGEPPQTELEWRGRPLEFELWPLDDGFLGIVRDISSRRELDRRRREMQRLVSHELKTPLSSIAGFGSMLESYTLSEDELRRVAGTIRGEAERLGEMVRTFLDLERLESGRWEIAQQSVELAELVRKRCELLDPSATSESASINLSVGRSQPITGAPQLLAQLIDNLVGNALKFSPEGSPVIVELEMVDAEVVLSVIDHGPGIPQEALPQLFERFYRVPGTGQPGSGLGLAVVKEIAAWHGARVEVDSEQGRGTSFRVRFPQLDGTGDDYAGEDPGR
jgi:signal transduction histidine kinase/CHASE2 domain-containing sensor protein